MKMFKKKLLPCLLTVSLLASMSAVAFATDDNNDSETGNIEMDIIVEENVSVTDDGVEIDPSFEVDAEDMGTSGEEDDLDSSEAEDLESGEILDDSEGSDNTVTESDVDIFPGEDFDFNIGLEEEGVEVDAMFMVEYEEELLMPILDTVTVSSSLWQVLQIDGNFVYCYDKAAAVPHGDEQYFPGVPFEGQSNPDEIYLADKEDAVRAVLYAGYPFDGVNAMSDLHSELPNSEHFEAVAYRATQYAIWVTLEQMSSKDAADDLVRYPAGETAVALFETLLSAADTGMSNPGSTLTLTDENGKDHAEFSYDEANERWQTPVISTSGGYGTFTLDLPAGITVVDVNGETLPASNPAGTKFQLLADEEPTASSLRLTYRLYAPGDLWFYKPAEQPSPDKYFQNLIGFDIVSGSTQTVNISVYTPSNPGPDPTPTPDPEPTPEPEPTPDPNPSNPGGGGSGGSGSPSSPANPPADNTEIADEDVPLAEMPATEDAPQADEELMEIIDEDVPLADAPVTGDTVTLLLAAFLLLLSAGALVMLLRRKAEAK